LGQFIFSINLAMAVAGDGLEASDLPGVAFLFIKFHASALASTQGGTKSNEVVCWLCDSYLFLFF
jgi:hypothetical protein